MKINDFKYDEIKNFRKSYINILIERKENSSMKEGCITYINIHGSCLSNDVFRYLSDDNIKVNKYIARSSVISVVSQPINISMNDINLSSMFQKAMVYGDINKTLFKNLKENQSDYLMIDLIDERFNLIKIDNTYITDSYEFKNSKLNKVINGEVINRFELNEELVKKCIDEYIKNILEIYREDQIIIHEVYNSDKYIDKSGKIVDFNIDILKKSEKFNMLLQFYYDYFKSLLPNAHVIDISKGYLANESHIWALETYHFEDKYYLEVLNIINNIIYR